MTILIRNGIPLGSGFDGSPADLWIRDERIVCPQEKADRVIDAHGAYLMPGLIDIHTHGSMGVDFPSAKDFSAAKAYYASNGVTAILATTGVRTMDELLTMIATVAAHKNDRTQGASVAGIHLEGPFLSAKKKGSMREPDVPCSLENFDRLVDAGQGLIRIMTIAPERENALEVIARGASCGVRMSLGHTDADYETAKRAIDAGATGATHTFNAMRSYHHREPGVLGAVLTDDRVSCEMICDEVHLHHATMELIRRCKGARNTVLISDSGSITGLGDGEYVVDGFRKIVKNGVSKLPNGTISGSCFNMADGVRNLLRRGVPLGEIARIGAENPARAAGIDRDYGSLRPGKYADVVLCDGAFTIQHVFVKGWQYV